VVLGGEQAMCEAVLLALVGVGDRDALEIVAVVLDDVLLAVAHGDEFVRAPGDRLGLGGDGVPVVLVSSPGGISWRSVSGDSYLTMPALSPEHETSDRFDARSARVLMWADHQ
jgi:hypothetical protein